MEMIEKSRTEVLSEDLVHIANAIIAARNSASMIAKEIERLRMAEERLLREYREEHIKLHDRLVEPERHSLCDQYRLVESIASYIAGASYHVTAQEIRDKFLPK